MTYQVSCLMRFANIEERDAVYNYLVEKKAIAVQNLPSQIERHTCGHDEGSACVMQQIDEWGNEVSTQESVTWG